MRDNYCTLSQVESSHFMRCRLIGTLVTAGLGAVLIAAPVRGQELTRSELARVDEWFRQTSDHTTDGQWGIVIGSMNGGVLWSMNPELELIPASTAKLFTLGFSRARRGGGGRIGT